MSQTNGSFNLTTPADLSKEVTSFEVSIPAASNAAQVVTPAVPVDAMTVFNYSNRRVRALITFAAGVVSAIPAASRTVVIPPNGTYSVSFAEGNDDAFDDAVPVIASVAFQVLGAVAATGLTSAAAVPASFTGAAATLNVNFASS